MLDVDSIHSFDIGNQRFNVVNIILLLHGHVENIRDRIWDRGYRYCESRLELEIDIERIDIVYRQRIANIDVDYGKLTSQTWKVEPMPWI